MNKNNMKQPWSFCETPQENCTMNYCDENGCQNRKRNYSGVATNFSTIIDKFDNGYELYNNNPIFANCIEHL